MTSMITKYQDSVSILRHRVETFGKSVKSCDITKMLDDNTMFIETLKYSNNIFESLPQKDKIAEKETFDNSKFLVDKYFKIKSIIKDNCRYRPTG